MSGCLISNTTGILCLQYTRQMNSVVGYVKAIEAMIGLDLTNGDKVVSRVSVAEGRVRIGNWIY
jgi:hypothetical protein